MKKQWLAVLLMIIIVPLAGELKFYPFDGEFSTFRISFGSPLFLFFLLWLRRIPLLLSGFLTGMAVLAFRMVMDWSTGGSNWSAGLQLHFPAFVYYVVYSLIFYLAKNKDLYSGPMRIASLAIFAEITASIIELVLSFTYSSVVEVFTFSIVSKVLIIAVIRSFFVLSFFFIAKLRHAEFVAEQQKEQNKHMLLLISSLYEEVIHLTKAQQNAENITKDCYNLYNGLKNGQIPPDNNQLAQDILGIAGQVHEIKKDNQRIYASLTRLISEGKLNDYMPASELADIIVQSHQKYARAMNKSIHFALTVDDSLPSLHVYTVLSLVNNLVSNAVEAIQQSGEIKIAFFRRHDDIELYVEDNGPGVPPKKQNLIFKPGYTTKFDLAGNPSTGMGLCYIKDLAKNLSGSIKLENTPHSQGTVFVIELPLKSLTREGS